MDCTTPVTPALLPAQGRQRDGKRQSEPPPYGPRPGRTAGGNGAPPPPPPAPQHKNAMDPPRGAQPPQGQSRAPTPARPRPQRGPRQPTQWTGSRGRRSARPQTPHATVEGAPPGTPCRRPHNPMPSRREPGPDHPPPSTPDGARDRGRTRGGARTTWNGPNSAQCRDHARCARHTTQRGGERTPRSASAHTRKGHAGTTGRATGPSARNAQTAWNGVPASEGKGHPDGTARHTQRGIRGAGRGKPKRHDARCRPEPPRTGRERRAHTDGALRPPRQ